jgi:hypothetical protein
MIHPEQMQDSVKHQDPHLIFHRVPKPGGLRLRPVGGDRNFAEPIAIQAPRRTSATHGKRQHISGLVLSPKIAIQSAQFRIISDQATELLPARHAVGKHPGKIEQSATAES